MPAMTQGMMENLEVSLLFFILDIVLIVMLLPLVLAHREKVKWAPLRERLFRVADEKRRLTISTACYAMFVLEPGRAHRDGTVDGAENQLRYCLRFLRGARNEVEALKSEVVLLSPALEPDAAAGLSDLLAGLEGFVSHCARFMTGYCQFATMQSREVAGLRVKDSPPSSLEIEVVAIPQLKPAASALLSSYAGTAMRSLAEDFERADQALLRMIDGTSVSKKVKKAARESATRHDGTLYGYWQHLQRRLTDIAEEKPVWDFNRGDALTGERWAKWQVTVGAVRAEFANLSHWGQAY